MANYIDQDQQWLLNCLTATLDTNQEVRSFAEESLNQASFQSGFGGALSKVAVNKDLPLGLRQISFTHSIIPVLLKQFIKKHWEEDGENFEQPIVSSEEKAHIRELLIQSLDDPHGKVCTAIGMAVASIAHYDCSENWPDLLPVLVKLISDQNNMNGVRGALRCLSLLSDDLDDMLVPALPVLFPCLHQIVSFPQIYDKSLRTKAISIVYSCTSVMGAMSAAYETETSALMIPMIKSWMGQFSALLQPPVQPDDPEDWSIRMEVLKCLNQFVQNFPVIVTPLWQTLVSSLKVYEVASIQGTVDPYLGRYDSDGTEKSLETLVIQVIARNMKELAYYTIAFMQVKEQQMIVKALAKRLSVVIGSVMSRLNANLANNKAVEVGHIKSLDNLPAATLVAAS
ncbi:hypothetical protein GIB67_000511 [Kingdonia uniflora]|uniref:Importin N-terminal domain-containing protein n=1 Tax=Kingdonia uniflora TaxID=39325 RepID=A0A7J7NTP8_9MAGN|nr:hypothetical protein GIB67_000511 [Kingdonia uniflora]